MTSTQSKLQENVCIIHAVLERVQTLTIVAPLIYQIPVRSATLPGSASVKVANSATRDATSGQGAPVCSWIRRLRTVLSSLRMRAARTGNSSRRGQSLNRRDGGTVMQGVRAPPWRRSRLLSRRCSRSSIAPVHPQLSTSYLYCLYHTRSPQIRWQRNHQNARDGDPPKNLVRSFALNPS